MDTEGGQLWVVGVGADGVMAFTADGIDNLQDVIAIHKEDPNILAERREALDAAVAPKAGQHDHPPHGDRSITQ